MILTEPTIDVMIVELQRAGWKRASWKRLRLSVWESPDGQYWRGPYGAWKVMKGRRW